MIFSIIISFIFGVFIGGLIGVYIKVKRVRIAINTPIMQSIPCEFAVNEMESITQIIEKTKRDFKKSTRGSVLRSVFALKRRENKSIVLAIKEEICLIANYFGKEGEKNLLNFSVKEFFNFLYDVTKKLEDIIDVINFYPLKTVDLSVILGLTQTVEKPIIKRATGVWGVISRIVNAINPIFWIKKLVMSLFMARIIMEIIFASIEVSAWQFAAFYHKPQSKNKTTVSV